MSNDNRKMAVAVESEDEGLTGLYTQATPNYYQSSQTTQRKSRRQLGFSTATSPTTAMKMHGMIPSGSNIIQSANNPPTLSKSKLPDIRFSNQEVKRIRGGHTRFASTQPHRNIIPVTEAHSR
jgi:hypothetical protein